MKTIFHNRYTRQLVMMILAMLPAMSWADTYISDVAVSCRANISAAVTELENNGYTPIMYDYNHNVPNCTMPGVIMGYKTTSDRTKAITDLVVMKGEQYKCDGTNKQQIVGNKVYRPIKAFGDTYGDFNSGCIPTADKLYLWYTKDVTGDGLAITALAGVTNASSALSDANYVKMFDGSSLSANCDLNSHAGGDWMYIKMTKAKPANATFKRNFTTKSNSSNTGKAYLRFYDIAKYFGIDQPNGEGNVTSVYLTEIKIDGVAYSSYHTGEVQITTSGDKNTFAAGGVTVTALNSSAANGGTKKTGFPVATSYKYRYEISYPHENVNEIQLTGYIQVDGVRRDWVFVLHKEENMYFTYPYSTTDGQLYLRYSDILRFLGYDINEPEDGAIGSAAPHSAFVNGVQCASPTHYIEGGWGSSNVVRNVRFKDIKVSVSGINTSTTRGLIGDVVPSGEEPRYGYTITYPRNEAKTYALRMYVAYTYTKVSAYANNEEEDYKFFYVVLSPDENSASPVCFNNSSTDPTAATAPLTANVNEPLTVYTYSPSSTQRTYQSQPSATSSLSDVIYSSNGINGKTFMATKPGTYTLTITQPAGNGYFAGSATRQVIVEENDKDLNGSDTNISTGVVVNSTYGISSFVKDIKSSVPANNNHVLGVDYILIDNKFKAYKEGVYDIYCTKQGGGSILLHLVAKGIDEFIVKTATTVANDIDITAAGQDVSLDNNSSARLIMTDGGKYHNGSLPLSKAANIEGNEYISGNMIYSTNGGNNRLVSDVKLFDDEKFDYVLANNGNMTCISADDDTQRTLTFNGRSCSKGVYYAMCIPFGVSAGEMPEDFIFERITEQRRWNDDIDKMEIGFQQVDHLEPGVPYIYKYVGSNSSEILKLEVKTPIDGSTILMVAQPDNSSLHFQGTFINLINKDLHQETIGNPYNNGYSANGNDENTLFDGFFTTLKTGSPLYALNSSNGKIEKLGANNSIRPFRAYFRFSDEEVAKTGATVGSDARIITIRHFSLDEDDEATTIFNLNTQEQEDIVDVYTVGGVRVAQKVAESEALNNLPKGIYILSNGNKIKK